MPVDQTKMIVAAKQDLRALEQKIEELIFEFKNNTGLPVYLAIEEIEVKTVGGNEGPLQRVRTRVVF